MAKSIRGQIKRYIGRRNITKSLLETIALGLQGVLARSSGTDVARATLDSIAQDASSPDRVICEVSIVPFFPANTIKVTIFV